VHLKCSEDPVRVSRLVGVLDGPSGASPPEILAPADGAVIVHPAEPPTVVFQRVPGAASYRLRFVADGEALEMDLEPGRDLKRIGTRLQYDLARATTPARLTKRDGGVTGIGNAGDAWRGDVFTPPRPVSWTLEALDAGGRSLGASAARSFVMVTTSLPR
jgi:hypothetical protein